MPFYTRLPDWEIFTFSEWPWNIQPPQTIYCFRITQLIDTPLRRRIGASVQNPPPLAEFYVLIQNGRKIKIPELLLHMP